jgi:DNA replication protein DnaC
MDRRTPKLGVLGQSSVGKTYPAQAQLNAACRKYYTARFFRLDD